MCCELQAAASGGSFYDCQIAFIFVACVVAAYVTFEASCHMCAVVNATRHACHMTGIFAHMLLGYAMAGQAVYHCAHRNCIVCVHFSVLALS